jgi:hypothetical protein
MKGKGHFGVRRMPVPGKVCMPYVTGHRQVLGKTGKKTWVHAHSKKKFRPKRAEKTLHEFLLAYAKPSGAKRKEYEFLTGRKAGKPLTEKECEAWAKKALAQIKGRGLGTLEMFIRADLFEEWWKGQAKYVNEGGQWIEKRQKGEKHRRAGRNWKKAQATIKEKARLQEQREKERQREAKRLERERTRRAWVNLEKPRAAVTTRPYI